jgi:hypothetical protein
MPIRLAECENIDVELSPGIHRDSSNCALVAQIANPRTILGAISEFELERSRLQATLRLGHFEVADKEERSTGRRVCQFWTTAGALARTDRAGVVVWLDSKAFLSYE